MTRRRPKLKELGQIDYEAIRAHEERQARVRDIQVGGRGQQLVSTNMIPPPVDTVPAPPPPSNASQVRGYKLKYERALSRVAELEREVAALKKELERKQSEVEKLLLLEQLGP